MLDSLRHFSEALVADTMRFGFGFEWFFLTKVFLAPCTDGYHGFLMLDSGFLV